MLKEVLKHVKTVAIGGHVRPDGDCVGSCLGLYQYIKENYEEIQADVYLEDIPDSFHFIKAAKEINCSSEQTLPFLQTCYDLQLLFGYPEYTLLNSFPHILQE